MARATILLFKGTTARFVQGYPPSDLHLGVTSFAVITEFVSCPLHFERGENVRQKRKKDYKINYMKRHK